MRKFRYFANPDEVVNYLVGLGYEVEDIYDRYGKEILGFSIINTTVDLSYDLVLDGKVVGHGMIRLLRGTLDQDPTNPNNKLVNEDGERYERSLKLYQKLKRRFGQPRSS